MTTKIIQNKCAYEWKVTGFDSCKTFGECLFSPEFSSNNGEFKWRLKLYPWGDHKEIKGFISLFLVSINSSDVKVKVRFTMDSSDYSTVTKEINDEIKSGCSWGYAKFCKRKRNPDSTQLLNNNLSVYCEFFDTDDSTDFLTLTENTKLETLGNMKQLLEDEDFCDVTIKVGEKEFRRHKAILAAGSKVFAAMFKKEMIEKKTSVIEIENIDAEIFEQVLKFIYTGEIKFEGEKYKAILVVADRYDIKGLKNLCVHKLCQSISINNVVELLKFADAHNVETLKGDTIDFIVNNAKNLVIQPVFNELKTDVSSDSLVELFRKLALLKLDIKV